MPNLPKQPGDAVLSRDGTVKVNGVEVGHWWVDGNDLYHFDLIKPKNPSRDWGCVTGVLMHEFKADIPRALERTGKTPRTT